jgi:hypothetical protein
VFLQSDTCDEDWQTGRDGLVISAFALSLVSFLFGAVVIAVFLVVVRGKLLLLHLLTSWVAIFAVIQAPEK